jgi:hypothetical protein
LVISSMEAVCSSHTCKSYELFGKDSALDGELLASTCIMRRGACDREGQDANKIKFDSVAEWLSPSLRDPMHRARACREPSAASDPLFSVFLSTNSLRLMTRAQALKDWPHTSHWRRTHPITEYCDRAYLIDWAYPSG